MQLADPEAVALAPTRDAELAVEGSSSRAVSDDQVRAPTLARQINIVARDPSQLRAEAAERRRLLTRALHARATTTNDEHVSEHATTDRFVRVSLDDLDAAEPGQCRARGTAKICAAVDQLRTQAAACRAKAIALNAKLVLLEAERARTAGGSHELHAVREALIESSARLDHAVEEIGAVTSVEQQLATLR